MKTKEKNMYKKCFAIMVALLLVVVYPSLAQQAYMYQAPTMTTENDLCDQGVGSVTVHLSTGMADVCDIKWSYGTGLLSNLGMYSEHPENDGQTTVSGLVAGTRGKVVVTVRDCDRVIYQGGFSIGNDDCDLDVSIIESPIVEGGGCNSTPAATYTASVTGGTPPYSSTWGAPVSANPYTFRTSVTVSGKLSIVVTDSEGKRGVATTDASLYIKKLECAQDPNEIIGPEGYLDSVRFVASSQKMLYTIGFENDPDFATAPASRVYVTYPVPDNQNISSFRLSDFGFGSFIFTVPSGVSSYSQRLDVSDSLGVWVDVTAGIDIVNNQFFWIFQSIDPSTGFEPDNAQMGFLPINDEFGRGEGYVSFFITPQGNVRTGDTVSVKASIIFDDNAPIETNVWKNTFDAVAPTSMLHCNINPADSLYCTFSFVATDDENGAGVSNVTLYMSENEGEYSSLGYFHPDSTYAMTLEQGKFYKLMSIATDNVGNIELFKSIPDTIIDYNTTPVDLILSNDNFMENDSVGTVIAQLYTVDDDVTQPFVYELVNGIGAVDNSLFAIVGDQLRLKSNVACINKYEFSVRIRTTDVTGLSYENSFDLYSTQENFHKYDTIVAQVCQGNYYSFGGTEYSIQGSYTDSLHTYRGCDSIVTLNLKVNPTYSIQDSYVVCDSLIWHGSTYTSNTDSAVYTLRTVNGCDSTIALNLTVNHSNTGIDTRIACDSINWHGSTYTMSSDSVTFFEQNVFGCDSVVTLNLTVNHSNTGIDVQNVCDAYTWIDGNTYTASNNEAQYTLANVSSCDSVVTLNLTIRYSTTETENKVACENFVWKGETYTQSGDYTFDTTNVVGCDSTVTLNLTINNSSFATETYTACDSITWHEVTYTENTNVPTFVTQNMYGCDSTVTLNLTVNHSSSATEMLTACDSLIWHDVTYTESTNDPMFTTQNMYGCDSTVTLNLTVNRSSSATEVLTACDSLVWHDVTYTENTDNPTFIAQNMFGCDSTVTLNLTVNHSSYATETLTACDSLTWHDITYSESTNEPTFTTQSIFGCDSTVTLNLVVNVSSTPTEYEYTGCDSIVWNRYVFYESSDTSIMYPNAVGCDSAITLHLTVNYTSQNLIIDTAVSSYMWNGTQYTHSGEYTYVSQTETGCDSIITLFLTIKNDDVQSELDQIVVYPNPTNGSITIGSNDVVGVEVYSTNGSKIETFVGTTQFDISHLTTGTYMIRIITTQGSTVRRVIKR